MEIPTRNDSDELWHTSKPEVDHTASGRAIRYLQRFGIAHTFRAVPVFVFDFLVVAAPNMGHAFFQIQKRRPSSHRRKLARLDGGRHLPTAGGRSSEPEWRSTPPNESMKARRARLESREVIQGLKHGCYRITTVDDAQVERLDFNESFSPASGYLFWSISRRPTGRDATGALLEEKPLRTGSTPTTPTIGTPWAASS